MKIFGEWPLNLPDQMYSNCKNIFDGKNQLYLGSKALSYSALYWWTDQIHLFSKEKKNKLDRVWIAYSLWTIVNQNTIYLYESYLHFQIKTLLVFIKTAGRKQVNKQDTFYTSTWQDLLFNRKNRWCLSFIVSSFHIHRIHYRGYDQHLVYPRKQGLP